MNGDYRFVTVPNGISFARLACVPVFVWLVLRANACALAAVLLTAAAISDWADGKLARTLHQESEFGAELDLMADGVLVTATLVTLSLKSIIPWWLIGALTLREIMLAVAKKGLREDGGRLPMIDWPAAKGIMVMCCGIPLMLVSAQSSGAIRLVGTIGLDLAVFGVALLYWSAVRRIWALCRHRGSSLLASKRKNNEPHRLNPAVADV